MLGNIWKGFSMENKKIAAKAVSSSCWMWLFCQSWILSSRPSLSGCHCCHIIIAVSSTMSATIAAFLAGAAGTMCYGMYTGKSTDEGDEAVNSTSRNLPVFASSSGTGFMSDMLAQMWPYINVAASKSIKDSVEPQFKDLPGPLGTLHFTKVNLGHVPLRLDNIIVHEVDKANNTLQMDMDVRWDGVSDIQLKANYLGSFGVKSIKLFGRMTILLKPMVETLSLVEAVQVAFVNPPEVRKYCHFKLCEVVEPCS